MYQFEKAKPIWGENLTYQYNQILGFRTDFNLDSLSEFKIALAARTYYRIYINGEMLGNGPARTAKGYCRVDEYKMKASGNVKLAVEIVAIDKPQKYSNDNTMEPGMLIMEISIPKADGSWEVIAATGNNNFKYKELLHRKSMAELMSHSRGIVEYYQLKEQSLAWVTEDTCNYKNPITLSEFIHYLNRLAPYPDYHLIPVDTLVKSKEMISTPKMEAGIVSMLAKMINPEWYDMLSEKDRFIDQLFCEKEGPIFRGYKRFIDNKKKKHIEILDRDHDLAFVFSIPKSELGFIHFNIEVESDIILDLINTDHLNKKGEVQANTYATRYALEKGSYSLTTFEPRLTRYIKVIIRGKGKVVFSYPEIIDYSYPDPKDIYFESSDGELNLIYEGSRRTLRLNTLDIFMDCPERERGGWLCDSQFTAWAAWQLFGDLSVETDFIENFMLTNPEDYKDGFFPEVYPGVKKERKSPGIKSWSFWLLTQLWDYYQRSGDREFIDKCFPRIEIFLDSLTNYIGESGFFENFETLFVDWSLSNEKFSLYPISIPVNSLIVHVYELMSGLYGVRRWADLAGKVRKLIEGIKPSYGLESDGYSYEAGQFTPNGCLTEAGIALKLWSGFGREEEEQVKGFVDSMGTCPKLIPDPNIGRANLFIGLMIRFDVLAKLGKINTLVRELKDVYLPQLLQGSGTLYENINDESGCHGFNGMAGAFIVNKVLGLGQPNQLTKTININPHPGDLNWASGNAKCKDGEISLEWTADHYNHIMDMKLSLPKGWKSIIEIPFELSGWEIRLNEKMIKNEE